MEQLDRLQENWVIVNASRELLSLVKKNPNISYTDAIKFAKQIAAEKLSNTKIGANRRTKLEKLYDKFTLEALGKSRAQAKEITAEKLIGERLVEIERYLNQFTNKDKDPQLLRREASELKALLRLDEMGSLGLQRVTENQAIMNDAFKRAGKVLINSELGKFNTYRNNEDKNIFRVTVLHPNPSEAIVGADLILEQYDETESKVRIVAIQYKIWENSVLYYSNSGNLQDQIKKMEGCFCKGDLCCDENGKSTCKENYRLPYCSAFLRPTDKLQNPNTLTTSSFHIPICRIDKVKKSGPKNFLLRLEDIKNTALKAATFEELFNSGILGSRWLTIKELEQFYKASKVLEPKQKIVLYAQNLVLTSEERY